MDNKEETKADSFFEELLCMEFFTDNTGWQKAERKKEDVQRALLQGVKLMNCFTGEKQPEGKETVLTDKQKIYLTSAIEYLTAVFDGGGTGISIEQLPLLLCLAEVAQNEEIFPEVFKNWWSNVIQI